jgi:hypothetical protein
MMLLARRALAFLAWSPLLAVVAGCASQSEGDRCDVHNGNVDCEQGLICKQIGVCCPPEPPYAAPVCNTTSSPTPDGGAPSDGSTSGDRDSGADSSAPDGVSNDAVAEVTDDRATVDAGADVPDLSADMSTPDVRPESGAGDAQDAPDAQDDSRPTTDRTSSDGADDTGAIDAPAPDAVVDAPDDSAGEASSDAPSLDVTTPIDVQDAADAPSADGPG